jgi:hypothetical protein
MSTTKSKEKLAENGQKKETERLRAALQSIANLDYFTFGEPVSIARDALGAIAKNELIGGVSKGVQCHMRESGGVQCELQEGHAGICACPEVLKR